MWVDGHSVGWGAVGVCTSGWVSAHLATPLRPGKIRQLILMGNH